MTKSQETELIKARPDAIPEGSHVHLLSHGHHIGSDIIDTWMPDGSAFWIWLDHGAGRRMVHETDDADVIFSATGSEAQDRTR